MKNRISVCIATYNGEKYIRQQLDSIICQLADDDEIIISDDASTDNTIEVIKSYNDKRIKLYHNKFHNYVKNFEFSLSKASGEFIFLSDQDDVWKGEKIRVMKNALSTYDLVCSNCEVVDKELNYIMDFFNCDPTNKTGFYRNFRHNNYLGCCLAFNNFILEKILPFPKGLISHDTWIGAVGEIFGKCGFISDKLILYRRHGENTSKTTEGSTLNYRNRIQYRLVILKGLLSLYLRERQRHQKFSGE